MPFWRREEPAHKTLGRELEAASRDEPLDPIERDSAFGVSGIHGFARPRRWEAVVNADAPDLPGDAVHFYGLEDGSLIVEEDVPDDSLTPLAEAVEQQLKPPYRAEAVRHGETMWAVAGNEIVVAPVAEQVEGDSVELSVHGDERATIVDGVRVFGSLPGFEALAGDQDAYVLRADRIEGDLWEIEVSPL